MGYRDSVNLTGCIATGRSSGYQAGMMAPCSSSYAGHRFLVEVIAHIVWLSFRFPFSLRMVEEMSAARGILVSHETMGPHVRPRDRPRQRLPRAGGKWRLDENSGVAAVELSRGDLQKIENTGSKITAPRNAHENGRSLSGRHGNEESRL